MRVTLFQILRIICVVQSFAIFDSYPRLELSFALRKNDYASSISFGYARVGRLASCVAAIA